MATLEEKEQKELALNVALSTLSERCRNLQLRLSAVEEENVNLRLQLSSRLVDDDDDLSRSERESMRDKISELTRQKMQLSEHIAMVSAENRQLWSRLSKLTKENETLEKQTSPTHQNLIRSKTFTQNAPNPKLREKFAQGGDVEGPIDVASFAIEEDVLVTEVGDLKKLADEMTEIKAEVSRQNGVLRAAVGGLKGKLSLKICKTCEARTAMENEQKTHPAPPPEPVKPESRFEDVELPENPAKHIDFLESKRQADARDKMCPMCGKIYSNECTFDEFQEHVEAHFIDDTEADLTSMDRFEMISHTVGNF